VLTGQLAQLSPTHLDGRLTDETRRTDLTLQAVPALVHQPGKLFRRHEGQSRGTEHDQIEHAFAR
jgi:hypothetical protein